MPSQALTAADVAYIRAGYFMLEELCAGREETPDGLRASIAAGRLPAASYVLDDGTAMFPGDYFALVDQAGGTDTLRACFAARHRSAGGDPGEVDEDWEGYLSGLYGVCLRVVLPETIVCKGRLVTSLEQLLAAPAPDDATWRARLRREVWQLDALEREFAPDLDRGGRFPRLPTRDLLIAEPRARYPDVFVQEQLAA